MVKEKIWTESPPRLIGRPERGARCARWSDVANEIAYRSFYCILYVVSIELGHVWT